MSEEDNTIDEEKAKTEQANIVNSVMSKQDDPPSHVNGKFAKGNRIGKAGRPKGSVSGRTRIIQLLDAVLEDPEIQKAMAASFVSQIMKGDKGAIDMMRTIIMPLVPKETLIKVETNADAEKKGVRILLPGQEGNEIE